MQEFVTSLKPAAIRIIKNATGNKTGYIYVDMRSEEEVEKALKKNKDYMGENQTVVCVHVGDLTENIDMYCVCLS